MKNFTAIYNTEAIQNCMYDFQAADDQAALKFAEQKFSQYGQESFRIVEGEREVKLPRYALRHATKGYFQSDHSWIQDPANACRWAKRFNSIKEAQEVAKTLTSLSGDPLNLEVVIINHPKSEYSFESYKTVSKA